jgi:hypothetical protein
MSVRPTQTKSGYPRRTREPYPTDQDRSTAGLSDPEAGVDPVGQDPEAGSRVADRRALRAARRTRRNVAIVCGLVVALCLILTILIVNMARIRTSGPQAVVIPVAASIGPPGSTPLPFLSVHQSIPGAPASQGGNP